VRAARATSLHWHLAADAELPARLRLQVAAAVITITLFHARPPAVPARRRLGRLNLLRSRKEE
jgi:hypothetical protein